MLFEFLKAIFTTWEFRPVVLLFILLMGVLYLRGWLRLRRTVRNRRDNGRAQEDVRDQSEQGGLQGLATRWRLAAYIAGLIVLIISLLSGLDAYGTLLFWVHMVQHLLLLMVVPPLLWLGDPFIYSMWGLPRPLRLRMGGLFADPSPFRHVLQKVTSAGPAWLYVIAATWIWHDGKMYDLALRSEVVHDLEHLTFFVAGMIFFWHVVGSAPHIHHTMSYIQRAAYAVSEVPANMFLGVSIAFAAQPLFAYYTTVPRVWGISVMDDQRVGGIIMWILGSMMYLMVALVLIAQFLRSKDDEAPLSEKEQATDHAMPTSASTNES